MVKAITERFQYSRSDLLALFLMIVFPIHVWAFFLAIRNFEGITFSYTLYDYLGYSAYISMIALAESVFVFICFFLLGGLLPDAWGSRKKAVALICLSLVAAGWAILEQVNFLLVSYQGVVAQYLGASEHPYRFEVIFLFLVLFAVIVTVVLPLILVKRSSVFIESLMSIVDRIVILSGFYLVIDVVGLCFILYRNVVG